MGTLPGVRAGEVEDEVVADGADGVGVGFVLRCLSPNGDDIAFSVLEMKF